MSVTVAVDANGADLGPAEVAAGAALAAQQGVLVLLFAPADEIGEVPEGVELIDAPISIAKAPDPVRAVRAAPDASIVLATRAVAEGRADAFVSGGSTGPALAAALFNIKRAPGIHRPALAIPVPIPDHPVTIVDVGANTEVRPEHLVQFGFMGAALAQTVLGVARPRVGLLSIGEEPTKGTPLVVEAHAALRDRLAEGGAFDFVGNVEGNEVPAGKADVVVTDGFTGNIALKLMEGVSEAMLRNIRDVATSSRRAKAGGMLLRPALLEFRDVIDPESNGGAYLLGLRRLGVVPHGRFGRAGIAQAILLAARGVRGDIVERTHATLQDAGALRRGPAAHATSSEPPSTVASP
ncbi:MAG: phosphate acyltransferase [Solirubrobacteraceae bacterium]|jgi:glycerol-3-phosphate acyltransferase PlsX|nr:phosphate acyltransferase [Solirubrobacteraceae bacterium]MEA2360142.1 phosphate acyltransferase [Solirubrobacteraceae bacterium]MEA2395346.1 phosphate acyltransferase [Solirubrobacteraceae bacterium]